MNIPPELRSLIESGAHERLVALNPDGESKSPRTDGQCKAMGGQATSIKSVRET